MTLPASITALAQMPRIPLAKIRENVITLRTEYDPERLQELGESMEDTGQLQPVIVQSNDLGTFDLVIGSRRFRAAKARGQEDIAGYVIDKRSPVDLLLIALAENLHRHDLNPFEEAQGFLRLMKEYGLDLKTIARRINKSEGYIRSRLQLMSMPEEVVEMVSDRKLPLSNVSVLARLPTGDDQVRFAKSAVKNGLNQSELGAQVRKELQEPTRKDSSAHELTPVKVQARVAEFTVFLQKVPRRLHLRRINANEKHEMMLSLNELESEVKALKETIRTSRSAVLSHPNLTRSHTEPNNHGQEWTSRDIKRIHSPRRPSDEELARELGRSPEAIRAMRSQTKDRTH